MPLNCCKWVSCVVCESYLNKAIIRKKATYIFAQHILRKNRKKPHKYMCICVYIYIRIKYLWKDTREIIMAAPGEGSGWLADRARKETVFHYTLVLDELFFLRNEILLLLQNVILLQQQPTKHPVVYYWPKARGWVGPGSSEHRRWRGKPNLTVFQALLTSPSLIPHTSPARRFQHQPCFHQQILWLLLQPSLESAHLSPSRGTTQAQAAIPSRLAHMDHGTSPLPPSTLPPPHRSVLATCPTLGHQPTDPSLFLTIPRHYLPQGLCTCPARCLDTLPPDTHMEAPSPPTCLCSNVPS